MKKVGTLLLLMSLGVFSLGCAKKDEAAPDAGAAPAAENGNGDGEMADDAGAADDAAGATTE